jgi:predicted small lipoprotein YifL
LAQLFADNRRKMALGLLAAAAVSVLATGCGRRGDPERPPSAAVLSTDEEGKTVETKRPKDRPFILDGLIQ